MLTHRSFPPAPVCAHGRDSCEFYRLQRIFLADYEFFPTAFWSSQHLDLRNRTEAATQLFYAGYGATDHAGHFGSIFCAAALTQMPLCLLGGQPSGIPFALRRAFLSQNFTEVGIYHGFPGSSASFGTPKVAAERGFLHAPVHPGFFKSLKGCGLRMSQSGFNRALGECPSSATCLHQQKFNAMPMDSITHGSNFFAFAEPP